MHNKVEPRGHGWSGFTIILGGANGYDGDIEAAGSVVRIIDAISEHIRN